MSEVVDEPLKLEKKELFKNGKIKKIYNISGMSSGDADRRCSDTLGADAVAWVDSTAEDYIIVAVRFFLLFLKKITNIYMYLHKM